MKRRLLYENLIQSRMACVKKNASFFGLLECRFSCGKAVLFMKIKYEFADGDVEVDVPNEWASILVELDRLERNNDKKERRRHYSLDACVYEGIVYASEDKNLTAIFETDSKFGRLTEAIKYLSDKQKSLIKAVYFDGMSVSDYAKHMGISQSAVSQQLKTIYKKLKKFL